MQIFLVFNSLCFYSIFHMLCFFKFTYSIKCAVVGRLTSVSLEIEKKIYRIYVYCFLYSYIGYSYLKIIRIVYMRYMKRKKILTPWAIVCPVIDSDVMDAVNTSQVYPPNGGSMSIFWYNTLTPIKPQVWFKSVYSIAGVICITF